MRKVFRFLSALLSPVCILNFAIAQEFPMIQDDPSIKRKLTREDFDFLSETLLKHRLAPQMDCDIRVRRSWGERKFLNESKRVETLDIEFRPGGILSSERITLRVPEDAKFGIKRERHSLAGIVEAFKVELGDPESHWLLFKHDGQQRLYWFEIGNHLRNFPCYFRGR